MAANSTNRVFVGTYTRDCPSEGIYAYDLDPATGRLTALGLAARAENPSFLAIDPSKRFLYAVSERGGPIGGAVIAYAVEPGGVELGELNTRSTMGSSACHVAVDQTSRCVFAANYGSGSVAAFPVTADGSLGERSALMPHAGSGPNRKRQEGPHAHSVTVGPSNELLFVADLGIDRIVVYRIDAERAQLKRHDPPTVKTAHGAGPRHMAFHPSGRSTYVINELNGTMTAYAYAPLSGTLTEINTLSTLPEGYAGANLCADVHVRPDGRFVYGTNRGHDSVVAYAIDPATGAISFVDRVGSGGKHPRNFAITPGGYYLLVANMESNNIVTFAVNRETGHVKPTGDVVEIAKPVCVVVM
jgi:6-phosphogluconolactonase